MTRHLHFDLVGGIAGDMTLGALVDAGAELAELRRGLRESGLPFTRLEAQREWRGGLAGVRVEVGLEADPPTRAWPEIRDLLQECRLPPRARQLAVDVFSRLATAEAAVHGCDENEVHFHEVGAMDSIVDVVGSALAVDLLEATTFSCSSVPVCQGTLSMAHGMLPLPAPATAKLLLGFCLRPIPGGVETVTPTGAAILAALCPGGDGLPPPLRLLATGCGMGRAELPDRPNVLRVLVGEQVAVGEAARRADAVVIEAAIDDMDPRLYGEVAARLFASGALDVALVPLQMKKGRPGTLLQIVARPELEGILSGLVLRETTTLGVRSHDVRRVELERRLETVETRFGPVRLKLGWLGRECVNLSAEYEDCVELARRAGVPVKDVLAAAMAAASERQGSFP